MADEFPYDVFLSHSSQDKPAARELAQRLKRDGLRVWFDEWVIQPGDSIPLAIERGLEGSRTLVLVMSTAALDSDWVTLERHTALFRDPTNQQRRFIPLRLDDCKINDTLKQFAYVDWRERDEGQYERLRAACAIRDVELSSALSADGRDASSPQMQRLQQPDEANDVAVTPDGTTAVAALDDGTLRAWNLGTGRCVRTFTGHQGWVLTVALTPDGTKVVSGSADKTVKIRDLASGRCVTTCKGHTGHVSAVAVTPDGTVAVSASLDRTLRIWDIQSGQCSRTISLGSGIRDLSHIAISKDGTMVASGGGAASNSVVIHQIETGEQIQTLEGHANLVRTAVFIDDDRKVISGSADKTLKLWDLTSGRCLATLEGHVSQIYEVVATADEKGVISASGDSTLKIWNLQTGECTATLQGHSGPVYGLAITKDGQKVISASHDKSLGVWDLPSYATEQAAEHDAAPRYTNAKALLVGDSGVGKTGLAIRLTENKFQVTESTDAHWATHLKLEDDSKTDGVEREIWLWDFAGQADYRLVHQLFMDETALAVLVFNPQSENPFEGLGQWDRDLMQAARRPFAKLLVAGRSDRGGLTVSRESIDEFAKDRGYQPLLQTSAKTGEGCEALREAIRRSIDWDTIPWTASPRIFKLLKEEIVRLHDEGFTLLRISELKQQLEMRLPDDAFTYDELEAVVGLLAGPGHVWRLEFGQFVLLRPERINSYAAAVGRTVRSHLQEIGVIPESAMLAGQLNFGDVQRLPAREEAIVLRAMHQTLIDHGFCLTQETDAGPLLVFPSYFNRERRDQIEHPSIFVTFRFSGALEQLYATLVVKLHHTRAFETEELWRYAADFRCTADGGGQVGLKMAKLGEGDAEIIAYCDPAVAVESKVAFIQYIHEHLKGYDPNVTLVRHYVCRNPQCKEPVRDVTAILRARQRSLTQLPCQYCFEAIPLWDELEQELASEKYEARVREMEAVARAGIDRESRDLQLEYHAFAVAEETSQTFVPGGDDDLGVQARIDLQDRSGEPSGRCLHLQLRPAEVYKSVSTNRDGDAVFEPGSKKLVDRWRQSESPVMLVHRTDDGYIRWMDVGAWLTKKSQGRKTPVKRIVFDGQPFTALNLQRIRDRLVPPERETWGLSESRPS